MTDATMQWNMELVKVVDLERARFIIPEELVWGLRVVFLSLYLMEIIRLEGVCCVDPTSYFSNQESVGPFLDPPWAQSVNLGALLSLLGCCLQAIFMASQGVWIWSAEVLQVSPPCLRKAGIPESLHRGLWGNKGSGLAFAVSKTNQELGSKILVSPVLQGQASALLHLISSLLPGNLKGNCP